MKKRIGIVGIGKMGILHGALLRQLPQVELVAMADTSSFVLKVFRSLLPSITYFTSYQKMISEMDLDAIVIATPSSNHVPIALMALEHNLDLFIEKPLSNDLESAHMLYAKAKQKPIISMVGYCLRYMPTFEKAREMLRNNVVGKVRRIESEMYISDVLSPQKGWRYDPLKSGGGVVMDFTVHMLDLLYWFFGRPTIVEATTNKIYSKLVEDEATITFSYADQKEALVKTSWSSVEHRKSYSKMRIIGDLGEIIVTDQTLEIIDKDGKRHKESYASMYQGYYFDIGGPNYSVQISKFVEAIHSRKNPEADLESGLIVQYLVDRIYQSALVGTPIPLNYDY